MIDKEKLRKSVEMFLTAIGEDPKREGLRETPDRVARMCEELFSGLDSSASEVLSRVFTTEKPGLVIEKDIKFYSMCEHHLLPFFGTVSIAYSYENKVVGLSKLARTVEVFARRPQIQENMTSQIADAIMKELTPKGVMVIVKAEHMCMSMRGVRNPSALTVTVATRGCFEDDYNLQEHVLNRLGI
ncbi:MAG: GTP cyclohydrolase I FolE [Treponema sp.]|jgi:GTP cyclohydrolase I|nr:GTP cyclohydrolase I FolE [Treponema sp.]